MFRKGARVIWTSQGSGTVRTKTGNIVAVIKKNEDPSDKVALTLQSKPLSLRLGSLTPRDHVSYLVVSDQKRHDLHILYWPKVKDLAEIEEDK